ncbi:hypothetical protein HDU96_006623 [Phlyctochytrium bullatum]|nr:hypothetical protein HDU96_006623 [Phlyctochytrium bullatum]
MHSDHRRCSKASTTTTTTTSTSTRRSSPTMLSKTNQLLFGACALLSVSAVAVQASPFPAFNTDAAPPAAAAAAAPAADDLEPLFRIPVQRRVLSTPGDGPASASAETDSVKSRFERFTASSFARASAFGSPGEGMGVLRMASAPGDMRADSGADDGGSDTIRQDAAFLRNLRDNTYNCMVELGNGQKFQVDLDTGSADTWFRGQLCTAKDDSCDGPKADIKDRSLRPTGVRFATHYGMGYVKGKVYIGDVKVGGAHAHNVLVGLSTEEEADGDTDGIMGLAYSSISQIARQTSAAIEQRGLGNNRAAAAAGGGIKLAMGNQMRYGLAAAGQRDGFDQSRYFGRREVKADDDNAEEEDRNLLSLIDEDSAEESREVNGADVESKASNAPAASGTTDKAHSVAGSHSNVLDALHLPVNRNMFGFYLSNFRDGDHGEVVFGGYDRHRVSGNMTWFKVNSESYWQFSLDGLKYSIVKPSENKGGEVPQERRAAIGTDSVPNAIADTGTTLVLLDSKVATDINTALGAKPMEGRSGGKLWTVDCGLADDKDAPVVRFHLPDNKGTFELNSKAYVLPSGSHRCITGFSSASGGVAIFGDVFLRQYYSVYDRGNGRVGFGKAVHDKLVQNIPDDKPTGNAFVKQESRVAMDNDAPVDAEKERIAREEAEARERKMEWGIFRVPDFLRVKQVMRLFVPFNRKPADALEKGAEEYKARMAVAERNARLAAGPVGGLESLASGDDNVPPVRRPDEKAAELTDTSGGTGVARLAPAARPASGAGVARIAEPPVDNGLSPLDSLFGDVGIPPELRADLASAEFPENRAEPAGVWGDEDFSRWFSPEDAGFPPGAGPGEHPHGPKNEDMKDMDGLFGW